MPVRVSEPPPARTVEVEPHTVPSGTELAARLRKAEEALALKSAELAAYQTQRGALLASLRRTTTSASWRATKVVRSLTRLLRPRPLTRAELVPATPMSSAGRPFAYQPETANPQLLLPCVPLQGYVRIRATISSEAPSQAHLYWDSGSLFNESEHVTLGMLRRPNEQAEGRYRLEVDRLHHLAHPAFCFRLDPVRHAGEFEIERLEITPMAGLAVDAASLAARWRRNRDEGIVWSSITNLLGMLVRGEFRSLRPKLRAALGAAATSEASYDVWRRMRALDDAGRKRLRDEAAAMADAPIISVLLPTYNTPEPLLRACIESVLGQTYPHWELCVADDASTAPHVRAVLDEYAERDARVRVTYRATNGHIAAASNTALAAARGSFVALLDHDDLLAEHALSAVARELVAHPQTDMVYSDEDKLTEDGKHVDPFFKPDWSPEYFLACMYTCHLGVYRTSLVREVGGFRSEFDQAQDYDMVLRLTAKTDRVRHVPDVLYHWRITPQSTAGGAEAKPQAHYRAQAAIRTSLADRGVAAEVSDGPAAGFHRVRYALTSRPRVTVVIPSACRPRDFGGTTDFWARRCVESLRSHSTYERLRIVVVGPPEVPPELVSALDAFGVERVSYGLPFNFSQACNVGAAAPDAAPDDAAGEHLLFLNDDTEVITPDFVEEMLSFSQLPEVGCVGVRLLFPDGCLQHVGVTVLGGNPGHPFHRFPADHPGHFFSARVHRNWSAVTAACVMIRREVFDAVGGFDEHFPLNYNDVDLCLRIRKAGYRVVYTPYAEIMHHESVTKPGTFRSEVRSFHDRWLAEMPLDPYYNPNLSATYGDFRIEV